MKAKKNPFYYADRVMLKDVIPLDTPLSVLIGNTDRCNFRCAYCVHSLSNEEKKKEEINSISMEWETFEKIVEQLKMFPKKIKHIMVFGHGEPLLHKAPEMVKYLKENEVCEITDITTNGFLLNKEMSDKLIDAGLDKLRISIQGVSAKKYYDVCKVKIDFEKFVDNIKYFYENKKNCELFLKVLDVGLDEGEDEKFYEIFGDICDHISIEHVIESHSKVDFSNMLDEETRQLNRFGKVNDTNVCYMPFMRLAVGPDGTIIPCCKFPTPLKLGNVNETTLFDVWNGEVLKQVQIDHLEKHADRYIACRGCSTPRSIPTENEILDPYADELLKKIKR